LLLILIIIIVITIVVMSYEANIGKNVFHIAVNPTNGNLAIPSYSTLYSKIVITDNYLNVLRDIPLTQLFYLPYLCEFSRDGTKLYVCISSMPSKKMAVDVELGKLAIIDTTTWAVDYYNLPLLPMQMYVSMQNNIVYIACGLNNGPVLVKIDTSTGQILNSYEYEGCPECGGLTMNANETKIYISKGCDRSITDPDGSNERSITNVLVYDSNFAFIKEIETSSSIEYMINGPDNRIYIAHACYNGECDNCLTVINTTNDEIEHQLTIPNIAAKRLVLNMARQCLFFSPLTEQEYYDEELDMNVPELFPLTSVIKVNLSDWCYSWINVANETIGPIAISPDGCRLYAAAVNTDSQKVYYVDLE